MSLKILNVVGARPNFMKIAPLMSEMKLNEQTEPLLLNTGQHYDQNLSGVFFEELGLPWPDLNLEVGSMTASSQAEIIESRFLAALKEIKPDLVLVVGDITSTVACARASMTFGCKLAHVEAGLRSFDLEMPEEKNRIETDRLSDFLYVTEPSGLKNLKDEKAKGESVLSGNVMIDTLLKNLEKAREVNASKNYNLEKNNFAVATFHRPSNVDSKESLENVLEILTEVSKKIQTLLPLHPRTEASLEKYGYLDKIRSITGLTLTEPLGYIDFISLLNSSKFVLTDSGGIQEETTILNTPCVTVRENTERPITITAGTNVLVGLEKSQILTEVENILNDTFKDDLKITDADKEALELWDGKAAQRIVKHFTMRLL